MNPLPISEKTKYTYSYRWGQETVEKFTEKLWRGTENLAELCNCSVIYLKCLLIHYIRQSDQTQWNRIKCWIKYLDMDPVGPLKRIPLEKREFYLTMVKSLADDWYLDGKFVRNSGEFDLTRYTEYDESYRARES